MWSLSELAKEAASCSCVDPALGFSSIIKTCALVAAVSTADAWEKNNCVYFSFRNILCCCFLAPPLYLCISAVFLETFIIRITIYHTVGGSVAELLACTQPKYWENAQEGWRILNTAKASPLSFVLVSLLPLVVILWSSPVLNVPGCFGLARRCFDFHSRVFCCCLCMCSSLMFIFYFGSHLKTFGVRQIGAIWARFKLDRWYVACVAQSPTGRFEWHQTMCYLWAESGCELQYFITVGGKQTCLICKVRGLQHEMKYHSVSICVWNIITNTMRAPVFIRFVNHN